jgi:hypothetical protein
MADPRGLALHHFKVEYGAKQITGVLEVGEIADETDTVPWGDSTTAVGNPFQRHGLTKTNNIRIERYLDAKENTLREEWKKLRDGSNVDDMVAPLVVQLVNDNLGLNKVELEVTLHNAWICKYGVSDLEKHQGGHSSQKLAREYAEFAGDHLEIKKGK